MSGEDLVLDPGQGRWVIPTAAVREAMRSCARQHRDAAAVHAAQTGGDLLTECEDSHPMLTVSACDGVHCYRPCDGVARAACRAADDARRAAQTTVEPTGGTSP